MSVIVNWLKIDCRVKINLVRDGPLQIFGSVGLLPRQIGFPKMAVMRGFALKGRKQIGETISAGEVEGFTNAFESGPRAPSQCRNNRW